MGILREELLAEEAADYGHAGIRQQVAWPNGVLAPTAVGLFMSLLPWSKTPGPALLEYDGTSARRWNACSEASITRIAASRLSSAMKSAIASRFDWAAGVS